MHTGTHGEYYWIELSKEFLDGVIAAHPEIVLDKFIVNTSSDSGPLQLSPQEIENGWSSDDRLAFSPRFDKDRDIPWGTWECYSEWYVFTSSNAFITDFEVFINYGAFYLQDCEFPEMLERFWNQLEKISPESYLADGSYTIFVTRNKSLFDRVTIWAKSNK